MQLVEPAALLSGFKQAKVIGRLLPRFDAASSENIDLFAKVRNAIFAPFLYKMHHFAKTGSGQT